MKELILNEEDVDRLEALKKKWGTTCPFQCVLCEVIQRGVSSDLKWQLLTPSDESNLLQSKYPPS